MGTPDAASSVKAAEHRQHTSTVESTAEARRCKILPVSQPADHPPFVRVPLEGEAQLRPWLYVNGKCWSALIDAEDEELVQSLGPWHVQEGSPSRRRGLCACNHREGASIYLHDLIMGAGGGERVWALNDDLLDCRKRNLQKFSKERVERERRAWEAGIKRRQERAIKERKEALQREWDEVHRAGFKTKKAYYAWKLGQENR